MGRGLGKLERNILTAVYERQLVTKTRRKDDPIMRRDELPELLWGWQPIRPYWPRGRRLYRRRLYPDYNAKQAALTRALHSLERKGLIEVGNSWMIDGRPIYSEQQATARGIAPAKTTRQRYTDAELDQVRTSMFTGRQFRLRDRKDLDVMNGRNAKALRLSDAGMAAAAALVNVK